MATIEIGMHVRDATGSDLEAVREVARASWETDYPDILSRESVDEGFDEWYGPDRLRENVKEPRSELLVAEVEESVIGFAHAFVDPEEVTLLRLYVRPGSRGEGAGRELFEALVERATEARGSKDATRLSSSRESSALSNDSESREPRAPRAF